MARILGGISKGLSLNLPWKLKVMFCRKRLTFNCNSDRCLYTLNQGKRHGNDRRCLLPGFPDRTNDRGCFLTLGKRSRRRVVRQSSTTAIYHGSGVHKYTVKCKWLSTPAALVLTFQRYSNICPRYVYPALFAFGLSIIDTIFLSIFFKVHANLVFFLLVNLVYSGIIAGSEAQRHLSGCHCQILHSSTPPFQVGGRLNQFSPFLLDVFDSHWFSQILLNWRIGGKWAFQSASGWCRAQWVKY